MPKQIPEEEFATEELRFERHLASVILEALERSGLSTTTVEERMRKPEGWLREYVGQLMDGETGSGGMMVRMAYAMDVRLRLSFLVRADAPEVERDE